MARFSYFMQRCMSVLWSEGQLAGGELLSVSMLAFTDSMGVKRKATHNLFHLDGIVLTAWHFML